MIDLEEHEKRPFMLSGLVVLLSLIAIVLFFVTNAGILFYIVALVAIILGIYLAYHIAQEAKMRKTTQPRPAAQSKATKKKKR